MYLLDKGCRVPGSSLRTGLKKLTDVAVLSASKSRMVLASASINCRRNGSKLGQSRLYR